MSRRLFVYNTPDSLAGLVAWLKADALALNDADPVASWTDSSGNGNHAAQATGTAQPSFRTNVLNGQPVIRFDGNDRLVFAAESNFDIANPTMIVVAKRNSGTTGSIIAKNTTGFADGRRRKLQISTASTSYRYNSGSDSNSISVTAVPGDWNMFGVIATAETSHSLFLNGAETLSATFTDDDNFNDATVEIGAAFNNGAEAFNGDIAEILVYNRALTGTEMTGVQNYLKAKYNLTTVSTLGATPRVALTGRSVVKDFGTCINTLSNNIDRVFFGNVLLANTAVTAAIWANFRSNSSSNYDVCFGYAGTARWFLIRFGSGNRIAFNFRSSSVERGSGHTPLHMLFNRWYLIVGTHDPAGGTNNTTVRVYNRNGTLYSSSSSTNAFSIDSTGNSLFIGRDSLRNTSAAAKFDEARVYGRALSVTEQDDLARNIEPSTTGLIGYWKFDEGSGTSVTDHSGSGITGTITGATYSTDVINKARVLIAGDIVP